MEPQIAEFRARLPGDEREWKEIPADIAWATDEGAAKAIAWIYGGYTPRCVQVRWNWTGSLQGNYVDISEELREAILKGVTENVEATKGVEHGGN